MEGQEFPGVNATGLWPSEICGDVSPVFGTGILDLGCLLVHS